MRGLKVLLAFAVLFGVSYARAAGTWTILDLPGRSDTVPNSISGSGIVG